MKKFSKKVSNIANVSYDHGNDGRKSTVSLIVEGDIAQLGAVINSSHPGRISTEQSTLFNGTGSGFRIWPSPSQWSNSPSAGAWP